MAAGYHHKKEFHMRYFIFIFFCNIYLTSSSQENPLSPQDSILLEGYKSGYRSSYLYSSEHQLFLDSMLTLQPGHAYYWQQKAMPMFKQKKYEAGMVYLDSAVKYDPAEWLDYRAFIKCIFQKSYTAAAEDFQKVKGLTGFSFVMDHSYDFYMGICFLQLNKFTVADSLVEQSIKWNNEHHTDGHYLEYFYLGIIKMELKNYDEAIHFFDKSLQIYPRFPDPQYYKALCLSFRKDYLTALPIMIQGLTDLDAGYTNNEDNNFYEDYPYQPKRINFESMIKQFKNNITKK
jgi:tetratricopeptide (TPR) repeat protein